MDTNDHDAPTDATDASPVRTLSVNEVWEQLRTASVGRLAVVHDGAPDIFPVNFAVDHGTVVIRTAAGAKYASARNQPVAFEIDGYDARTHEAWSVVLHGTAKEVHDLDDTIAAMELPLHPWAAGSKPHVLRIAPTTITGRCFTVDDDGSGR